MKRQSTTTTSKKVTAVSPPEWWPAEPEVLLQAFFNSPGAMRGIVEVISDDDVRHVTDNAETAAFMGLAPELLRGKLGSELGEPPDSLRRWVAAYKESERSGAPVSFEYLDSRAGCGRWISAVVSPLGRTPEGNARFSYVASDVTERKRAEAAARENEERLRTVVENSQDGINMLDLHSGRYVFMSPTQVQLTGFTAEEINNLPAAEAAERVHPDDRWISIEQQKKIAEGQDPGGTPVEYRWKVKSGEYRWFSDSRKLVRDAQGRPVALVGVSRDITEQKRAEEGLRKSEQQFRVLVENVSAAVALIDETGRFSLFNQQFLAMFGLSRQSDVRNVNDQDWSAWQVFDEQGRLLHVDEHPVRRAALTGRAVRDTLVQVRLPDGSRSAWLLVSAEPLLDENGRPECIICTYNDITARKQVELALRESEARFRSVLDGSRDVIYRVNVETDRYEYISPSCETLVGFSAPELMAMDVESSRGMIHPEDAETLVLAIQRLAETGREQVEYRQRTKAGDYRWMSNHMALVRDGQGRPLYREGNIRDITEQKRLASELQATVSQLEHANQVKDEFLATLSHELRTPLNAILGWSDMLMRPGLPPDVRRKALESIRRNSQAQSALISDILDVSSIITGKLRLDVGPIDLGDVVKAACAAVQPAAEAKGISLRTSIESGRRIAGDAERLQQVVWNLLSNSVKFTARGGRVDVTLRAVGSHVQLEVRDDGAGIAPEFLPHVFERFRQADSSTARRQAGLGLGLAIVRSLTELHGGTVTASSEGEGKGAVFTVRLPVRAVVERASREERAKEDRAGGLSERCLEGLHVLLVDDQEEARELTRVVLERYAGRVTTCSTAQEALNVVVSQRPDMLLADIGMPECDGYELIRRVRALPTAHAQTLPAIALTAYGGAHDRAQALSAGFWEHLAKPVLPDVLVHTVAAVAGRASWR